MSVEEAAIYARAYTHTPSHYSLSLYDDGEIGKADGAIHRGATPYIQCWGNHQFNRVIRDQTLISKVITNNIGLFF